MKTGATDTRKLGRIVWNRYCAGWWDAMQVNKYGGWSVARQGRVRWVRKRPQQYDCGWYVFNDATNRMIGPFKTRSAAKHSYPLVA
jgi:hypothetical protein